MDTTLKLKQSLNERINSISDIALLQTIDNLINAEGIYELSNEQLATVKEAQADIENGNLRENDEVLAELREWLEKK